MHGRFVLGTFAVLAAAMAAIVATAEPLPPRLSFPLECEIGKTCYIQKYVDHDASEGYQDYRCGVLSGDKHDGTDIRLVDVAAMNRGAAVLAAAAGTVHRTRDGMPDVSVALVTKDAVTDRGLGNSVIINHGGKWLTIYGHLRQGSVTVKPGDSVQAGQILGQVGMSGLSEFPHVHFAVRHNNVPIDPFVGSETRQGCDTTGSAPLWQPEVLNQLSYIPSFIMHSGFATRPMARAALQYGLYHQNSLTRQHGNLLFGVYVAGLYDGDQYAFTLQGPDGALLAEKAGQLSRRRGVQFFTIRHGRGTPLPRGLYRAKFTLTGTRVGVSEITLEENRTVTLN